MAKLILINYQGEEAQFSHKKVDRSKLYGSRKRIPLDPSGENCLRCELSDDGSTLIMSGMTSQGYFDSDLNWIPNKELISINKEAAVIICLGLAALIKKSIGLKKIPPPIPTIPDTKPSIPPIKIEIINGIFR